MASPDLHVRIHRFALDASRLEQVFEPDKFPRIIWPQAAIIHENLRVSSAFVRQAQLGASYRVTCHTQVLCMTGSLYRVEPGQQPVPSVA